MKGKRFIKLLLVGLISITMLSSCGKNSENAKKNNTSNNETKTESSEGEKSNNVSSEKEAEDKPKSEEELQKEAEELQKEEESQRLATIEYINKLRSEKFDNLMKEINLERDKSNSDLYKGLTEKYLFDTIDKSYNEELTLINNNQIAELSLIEKDYEDSKRDIEQKDEIELNQIKDEYDVVINTIDLNYNAKKKKIEQEYEIAKANIDNKNDIESGNDKEDDGFDYNFGYGDEEETEETSEYDEELKQLKQDKEEKIFKLEKDKIEEEYLAQESKNNKEGQASKNKIDELAKLDQNKINDINSVEQLKKSNTDKLKIKYENKKQQISSILKEFNLEVEKENEIVNTKIYELASEIKNNYNFTVEQMSNFESKDSTSWEPILNNELKELKQVYMENDKKFNKNSGSLRFIYKAKVDNLLK